MIARAVFLDKDGTLVEDIPYNVDPAQLRLSPGARQGIRLLSDYDYRLIVISNQSGIARGFFDNEALLGVERRLRYLLEEAGTKLAGFYYCPHHPEGSVGKYALPCSCRKPGAALIIKAAEEHSIDLRRSWLVGNTHEDIEAGHRAGCKTLLISQDSSLAKTFDDDRRPDYCSHDLCEGANLILAANQLSWNQQ
jgi:D-glycero-D-manno-heptose 1,7-bisphosphate phosphatase